MLRKRTRSQLKDSFMGFESNSQSDVTLNSKTTNPFFTVPGLFIGLSPKGLSDCDSVRSPTSPLDIRAFSNLANVTSKSFGPPAFKKWDRTKVGLSIIDSLNNDVKEIGKVFQPSESKNILFGSQMRIKPPNCETFASSFEASKSLPFEIFRRSQIKTHKGSSDVVFEIGETALVPEPFGKTRSSSLGSEINPNLNSGKFCFENLTTQMDYLLGGNPNTNNLSQSKLNSMSLSIGSGIGSVETLSASEIELSEDYTCVISHGPNPKTIHIFGDNVLECHSNSKKEFGIPQAVMYPTDDFLICCYSCDKKLEGKDIYIYRGEKSFCSLSCRSQEILIDEALEESFNEEASDNTHVNHNKVSI